MTSKPRSGAGRCRLPVVCRLAWVIALVVFRLSGQSTLAEATRLNNLGAQLFSGGNFAEARQMGRRADVLVREAAREDPMDFVIDVARLKALR